MEVMPLEIVERAQIDMQIATAKRYPRSLGKFKANLISMATLDTETAESCIYALPRAGKTIQGPSVRLMEMAISAWGNLRAGTRIVGANGKTVTAQAICHDLETNTCITIEKQRRITDKDGRTFNDDMQIVTANAAASVALRDCVGRVIPKAYIQPAYVAARELAIGKEGAFGLADRRRAAVDYFRKMGIDEARVLQALGRARIDDVNIEDMEKLTGFKTAIKSGDTTVDECFPFVQPEVKFGDEVPMGAPGASTPKAPKVDLRADFIAAVDKAGLPHDKVLTWLKTQEAGARPYNDLATAIAQVHGKPLKSYTQDIASGQLVPAILGTAATTSTAAATDPLGPESAEVIDLKQRLVDGGFTVNQFTQWGIQANQFGEVTDLREIPNGTLKLVLAGWKSVTPQLAMLPK